MPNMSYCRFTNTRNDLSDCLDALRDSDELSEEEAKAARWMLEEIIDFLLEEGIIEDEDKQLGNRLTEFVENLRVEE